MPTPLDQENAISLAVVKSEMEHLKAAVADLKFSNARQDTKLDEVLRTMHEAKGGWRLLLLIGGAAGTVGGLIAWLFSQFRG